MKKEDCIFCKIANGDIPSKTLYEDEDFRVILDLGPATKGHALILPKEHADNLYESSYVRHPRLHEGAVLRRGWSQPSNDRASRRSRLSVQEERRDDRDRRVGAVLLSFHQARRLRRTRAVSAMQSSGHRRAARHPRHVHRSGRSRALSDGGRRGIGEPCGAAMRGRPRRSSRNRG